MRMRKQLKRAKTRKKGETRKARVSQKNPQPHHHTRLPEEEDEEEGGGKRNSRAMGNGNQKRLQCWCSFAYNLWPGWGRGWEQKLIMSCEIEMVVWVENEIQRGIHRCACAGVTFFYKIFFLFCITGFHILRKTKKKKRKQEGDKKRQNRKCKNIEIKKNNRKLCTIPLFFFWDLPLIHSLSLWRKDKCHSFIWPFADISH